MKTYIALFRGINVGGSRSLPMKDLVSLLEGLGSQRVKTYIQSGNVVFRHNGKSPRNLAKRIGAAVEQARGFEPHVLLLEPDDLEKTAAANPFPDAEAEPKSLHVFFLDSKPKNPDLEALEAVKRDSECFSLVDATFYLHAPDGIGRSKLAARAEKALGVPVTARNWRSVCKIAAMAKE